MLPVKIYSILELDEKLRRYPSLRIPAAFWEPMAGHRPILLNSPQQDIPPKMNYRYTDLRSLRSETAS